MLTVRSTINIASQTVPPIIPVVQGDTGRAILFTLADFTIPAGASATYYVQKPSGEAVYNNATIDGNTVLVELTAQSIIEKGDNYGQVRITVGEDVVTSFDFILLVKEFRGIDAVQSLTEMNIFDKAVEQAAEEIDEVKTGALNDIGDAKDAALQEIEQSTGNFADAFSASTTYVAGDYVIHSGQLYRFTANHAAGAWTGSDAEAVTVGEELTDLKADTTTLKDEYKQFTQSDLYRGVWENSSSPTYWDKRICTAKLIKITAGDKFVYSTGILQIAFGTYTVDGSTNNAYVSWHTVNDETEYVFDYDGYFFMQFKKADGSAVTISEYDATCKLYYGQNYTAYATKDLLRNTIGLNPVSLSWVQGGLSETGETTDNARIRTSEYVLMPDSVYLHPKDGYKVLIYLYDSIYNVLSVGDWQTGEIVTTKSADAMYFRLAFAKTSNASISPSEASNLAVTYSYADIGEKVTKIESKIHPKFGNTYYGLSVNNKHGYNARKILTISYAGTGTLNSIAVYGNYIVAIINGLNLLRIYDKTTKALLHELSIDLGHANNVGLGNKYDESDPIPLLYVEKEDTDGMYNVVRITSEWTASIIKKYTFPSDTYGHYPQVTWNFEDGVCYSIGYKASSLADSNACIFVRSNLNEEGLNEDGSYTPQKMFTCETQKFKFMQDSKYFHGLIYLAHSTATDSSAVSHILMVDTSGGNIVSRIPAPFNGEIEGVALYEDNGEIKMCTTTYFDFYEMTFA